MLPMANPIDNSGHHQNHGLSPYEHQQRQEEEQDVYGLLSMEAQAAQNTALARNTMITIRFQVRRLRLTSTARRYPSRWSHSDPTFQTTARSYSASMRQASTSSNLTLQSGHCILPPQCLGCFSKACRETPLELSLRWFRCEPSLCTVG